ncbi:hypothetical protein GFS31_05790 [Leptolyngbya sp. BL0902]|nr:hypothetical protein GFS31_05790 [Leptolyngbya sp. BL0902]
MTSSLVAGLFILTSVAGWAPPAQAQAGLVPPRPVTAITTQNDIPLVSNTPNAPYANPCDNTATLQGCSGAAVDLAFGSGNNRVLVEFQAATVPGGLRRVTGINEQIEIRRNLGFAPNGSISRDILFYESTAIAGGPPPTNISLAPEEAVNIADALISPIVNRGIDNVFNNIGFNEIAPGSGQDTRINVERIDYILRDGVVVPPEFQGQEGFLVLERGGNDPFLIAAITSLDANGNPASYGDPVLVRVADWGVTNDINFPSVVFRRENAGGDLQASHSVGAQSVRGIFFPVNALLSAPESNSRIFGYSLMAADVPQNRNAILDWNTFPTDTVGAGVAAPPEGLAGGLDLVAGGFGLFRVPRPPVPGNLFLNKRITQLTAAGTAIPFPGTVNPDGNAGFPALELAGLGQGTVTVANPELAPADQVEYTLYINNTGETVVSNAQICDQIPPGTAFAPNAFGAGRGVQAIAPTNSQNPPVNYPTVTYTNAADGDPATFFPPGAPLPAICGANQGNGAVVVTFPTVGPSQVGYVRFRTTVNPF